MKIKHHWGTKLDDDSTAIVVAIVTSIVTSTGLTFLLCTKWQWLLELL